MDTSKEYIKMCDCPEIEGFRYYQETYFNWEDGDWAWSKVDKVKVIVIGHDSAKPCFSDIAFVGYQGEYNADGLTELEGKATWLPRQDQVQEMIGFKTHQVGHFSSWVHEKDDLEFEQWQHFNSMEQLWLAFYMWEKHNKIWTGEKWEHVTQ